MIPMIVFAVAVVYAFLGGLGLVPHPWWVVVLVVLVGGGAAGWMTAPIWRRE